MSGNRVPENRGQTSRSNRQAKRGAANVLLEEYLTPPHGPGHRPAAWWEHEAGREQYASELPAEDSLLEYSRLSDEREVERLQFLAAGGHLSPDELAALHEAANEARLRIDSDAERGCLHTAEDGSQHVWTGPDRLAVKVWTAVLGEGVAWGVTTYGVIRPPVWGNCGGDA